MDFETAVGCCHVRSAIYRESKPSIKYWKNSLPPFDTMVSEEDKKANDWREFDPRDEDKNSLPSD